ncbi:MAG: beta-aspartyl-peptidase [Ruminococcaceae bacterium]|nr:beta-aspartyl-peptidase [Oscillospiraceae bacterium]
MLTLIENVRAFRDGEWKESQILIAGSAIERIADRIDCTYDGLEHVDGRGMYAVPGYIDQHVHVTGGGGEGSFITQVPPIKLSAPVMAGITTIVGTLGTDGTTRSVANLVAKTRALNEFGMTAYCLTGNYNYPSPTLTGSVLDDIVFLHDVIGVKIAISDHRSANMSKTDLIKLASDARVAGLLAGKAGIVHLHVGAGKAKLSMLFEIVEETDIPISVFRPTHIGKCYDDAIRFTKAGGYVDFTCAPAGSSVFPKTTAQIVQALDDAPAGLVTMSTDGNGSCPFWNAQGELVGITADTVDSLPQTVASMVRDCGCPLEKAILPVTENVARALGLYPRKGVLAKGSDADILLLGDDLMPDTVFACGRCMVAGHELKVQAYYEDL